MQKAGKGARRASIMLTMEPETKQRLKKLAEQRHTSISQMITDWAWKQRLAPSAQDEAAE